jgi:hypothetical protein
MSAPLPVPGRPRPIPGPSSIWRDIFMAPLPENNFSPVTDISRASTGTLPYPRPRLGSNQVKPKSRIHGQTMPVRKHRKPTPGHLGSNPVKPIHELVLINAPLPIPGQPQSTPLPSAIRRDIFVVFNPKNNPSLVRGGISRASTGALPCPRPRLGSNQVKPNSQVRGQTMPVRKHANQHPSPLG